VIDWFTRDELAGRLATYAPIGLRLRSVFHARTTAEPTGWFARAAEVVQEAGVGDVSFWSGLVEGTPFEIAGAPRRVGWGFEVRLPQRSDGDRVWAIAIRGLGLPVWTHPYFESIPVQRGFGIVAIADAETPIYRSVNRDDATSIAAMLNDIEPASYAVVSVSGGEPSWVVVGPDAGPYVSRVAIESDERSARARAYRWAVETGAAFRVGRTL
jgi:hypothetical protein